MDQKKPVTRSWNIWRIKHDRNGRCWCFRFSRQHCFGYFMGDMGLMRYGIGYQGSKNGIAEQIIAHLPAGRRLVDLFGGGFAISHCALLSGKWEKGAV